MPSSTKRILKKTLKAIAWVAASLMLLLVAIVLLIRLPSIQTWATRKAVSSIEKKIGTDVALGSIFISFPKSIVVENFYMEDQKGDTLLFAGRISVDTDLWALTQNEIQLNKITFENIVGAIDRQEHDSAFNFTYILHAFAGDSTAVPDTLEQKAWNISMETLQLDKIRLRFDDRQQGNLAELSLGSLQLDMNSFDLENNFYSVEKMILENTRANVEQTKIAPSETNEEEDSTAALIFGLDELALNNVTLTYRQVPLGQSVRLDLGNMQLLADKIDLQNQEIDLNTFSLKETFLSYHQSMPDTVLRAEEEPTPGSKNRPWKIALEKLDLSGNSLQYFDFRKTPTRGSVDFSHLWVTAFAADVRDLLFDGENMQAEVRNIAFREQSGFALKSFQAALKANAKEATIGNLVLVTGHSRLQLDATARYRSLDDLSSNYARSAISADVNKSHINVADILYFSPDLLDSLPLTLSRTTSIQLDGALRGSIADLQIDHLLLRSLSDTYLGMSGKIAGLPAADNISMDLLIDKFHTTRSDIEAILPDTLLPDSIQLPGWMTMQAGYKGTLQIADFNTTLHSDAGSIEARGNINLDSTSVLRGLNLSMAVKDLDAGSILMKADSVMGTLGMKAHLQTKGLTPEEMTGTLTAFVDHFDFNDYRYSNLTVTGGIRDQRLSLAASMNDKNLDFSIDGGYSFSGEVPVYDLTVDLKNADFRALNLSVSPIRARGTLAVNMATPDFKTLNGNIGIRKVAIFNGDDLYAVDSLLFASIDQEGRSEINVDSDLLQAKFSGSINIFGLPAVMRDYFSSYYSLKDSVEGHDPAPQHFSFEVQLKNTDLLTDLLVPQLTTFEPGPVKGEFDSRTKKLDLTMEIGAIQYANIGIRSLAFNTNSDDGALRYDLNIDKVLVDSMKIDGVEFKGTVANNSINTNLTILDSADKEKYILMGTFFSRNDNFELKLAPTGIVLNYQDWQVPPDNLIAFGGDKVVAQNVELTNRREKITIRSDPQKGTPISVGFRELNLEYLTNMIAEERLVSGLLDGDINLFPDPEGFTFTSDLDVRDLRIRDVGWGNLSLHVEQKVKNRFDVNFGLSGNENDVTISGFYMSGASPSMDIQANFGKFNLNSLQPILVDQVRELKGVLTGKIQAKGNTERPDIDGQILVSDAAFFSNYLNTRFSINAETIAFVDEGIAFDAFEIADERKNKARLDGVILTRTYRDFEFKLDLSTNNFRLFNTTEKDNDLFYGKVDIEANARIRGNMTTPIVNVDIGLSEGSNLTYVVPQSEASAMEADGIVKFVDRSFEGDPFMQRISPEIADTIKSTFRGIDLTARVELTDQESFTIIIDPITKDQLTIRGNSTLTLQVDPTGDINLTGRYEIQEGTYNLSFYKFVKREFDIESGSSITWLGDPMNARMDIKAIFNVETAPIELFSNQLTGADPGEVNQYKQRLPFMVYLNISGELLQPEISFKLEMPMDKRNAFGGNIYARLQDINTRESDLNKQVFALLILKRFISDDPFQNQGAGGFQTAARNSVSKILSEQLNRLSENIKGVELSFDIKSYEDYTTGQAEGKTELQLGVSKSLFNDRLVVKLSGNIDIEGQDAQRDATDYIGDLALEYKVTPDGRFRITGFRNSNYDMIDGELTETGAGLIYVKDYNSLSELFKANAETKN